MLLYSKTTLALPNEKNKCKANKYRHFCYDRIGDLCERCEVDPPYLITLNKQSLDIMDGSACSSWPLNKIDFRAQSVYTEPFYGDLLNTNSKELTYFLI